MTTHTLYMRALEPDENTPANVSTFIASTSDVARDGDVIDWRSWRLENYHRNPVVLWSHNSFDPPIGKGRAYVDQDRRALMVEIEWDTEDPRGAQVASKVKRGFISTVSVQWKPGRVQRRSEHDPENEYYGEQGRVHYDAELYEVSPVSIPADPGAVVTQRADTGEETEEIDAAILDAVRWAVEHDPETVRILREVVAVEMRGEEVETEEEEEPEPERSVHPLWAEIVKVIGDKPEA